LKWLFVLAAVLVMLAVTLGSSTAIELHDLPAPDDALTPANIVQDPPRPDRIELVEIRGSNIVRSTGA
jgi:hypothetical protein